MWKGLEGAERMTCTGSSRHRASISAWHGRHVASWTLTALITASGPNGDLLYKPGKRGSQLQNSPPLMTQYPRHWL